MKFLCGFDRSVVAGTREGLLLSPHLPSGTPANRTLDRSGADCTHSQSARDVPSQCQVRERRQHARPSTSNVCHTNGDTHSDSGQRPIIINADQV